MFTSLLSQAVKSSLGLGLVATLAFSPTRSHAAVGEIYSNVADAGVRDNGDIFDAGNFAVRTGEYFAPGSICLVLPFQIPTLEAGQGFSSANLRMQLFGKGGPAILDLDLYGLGLRATPTVLGTDFYTGADPDTTDATLIQAGYMTAASPVRDSGETGPWIDTDASGDAALVSYLNSVYGDGSSAGQFLFLRLSYHASPVPGGDNSYSPLTANAGPNAEKPLITYTTAAVPEPGSAMLALLGGSAFLFRRRKARG